MIRKIFFVMNILLVIAICYVCYLFCNDVLFAATIRRQVLIGDITPTSIAIGDIWVDTSGSEPSFKIAISTNPVIFSSSITGNMQTEDYDSDDNQSIDVIAGGTNKTSYTPYAIHYSSSAFTFNELAIGMAGDVLTVNGTVDGYTWQAASNTITAGDGLTYSGSTLNFDGGSAPGGSLGGTWSSPTVDDDSHNHTGTTISGLDISDDTNLSATNPVVLTDDVLSLNYSTDMLLLGGDGKLRVGLSTDFTVSGSSVSVADGTITLAKMADLAANSIIGNNTGGATTPIALTAAQTRAWLGLAETDTPTFYGINLTGTGTTTVDGIDATYGINASTYTITEGNSVVGEVFSFGVTVDSGTAVIGTGEKGYLCIPFACKVTGWTLSADTASTTTITVSSATYGTTPAFGEISGSEDPSITAAIANRDLSLDTWTTAFDAGGFISYNVTANDAAHRISLTIRAVKQ